MARICLWNSGLPRQGGVLYDALSCSRGLFVVRMVDRESSFTAISGNTTHGRKEAAQASQKRFPGIKYKSARRNSVYEYLEHCRRFARMRTSIINSSQ